MKNIRIRGWAVAMAMVLAGCNSGWIEEDPYAGPNPFLEQDGGKQDSGYLNMRGVEVEVALEADVEAPDWRLFDSPPELAQFAVTYLRNEHRFYLEILAEDATAPERVEWLVNGEWLDSEAAHQVDRSLLKRFRMRGVNAVVVNDTVYSVRAGQVFDARVPVKPYSIMTDASDKCAEYNSHIDLSQSVYWYLWDPERNNCPSNLLQTMTVTVEQVLSNNPASYPEYDKLWEDGRLDVVVLFGKLDHDGDIKDDYNWRNADRFCDWLIQAGFEEQAEAPVGRRFVKHVGELIEMVDVYYPDAFHSVADHMRIHNWQRAVREHEVVMYNGHSVLGSGLAFEQADYPDFYQIFQVASCLSYEYYVRPVLNGKGDWSKVDVLSNVEPTYYHENLPLCGALLAKLFQGFENGGRVSWQDIMENINRKLGHARFGVSGAKGNCFSPNGNVCHGEPHAGGLTYENHDVREIPDNDQGGITSSIEIPESVTIETLEVEVDLEHTYMGDLQLVLEHAGAVYSLRDQQGGGADDLRETFEVTVFNGNNTAGTWTLRIIDRADMDTGRLNHWVLKINGGSLDPDPGTTGERYENDSPLAVPDQDAGGVVSVIEVPGVRTVGSLRVELDISHTYVGDLQIVLEHGGVSKELWAREGGGADDIRTTFDLEAFAGLEAAGTWSLRISDHARLDEGQLNRWALVIE